eukprot:Skav223736  [mRNA]  locus=scaffold2572:104065:115736:+ [translate_table: standard]
MGEVPWRRLQPRFLPLELRDNADIAGDYAASDRRKLATENKAAAAPHCAAGLLVERSDAECKEAKNEIQQMKAKGDMVQADTGQASAEESRKRLKRQNDKVLHAAAWLDFKTHIAALLQAGKLREAFRCWVSVVEIFHAPWQAPSLGEFDELPPLRRAACGEFPCDRCATRRGGFKFPWLGTWTSRGVLVPHGANPMQAWAHYQRNTEKLDLILLAMYSSPLDADDVCPQEMYGLQLRPAVHPDRPGLADSVEIFAYWRVWLGALGGSPSPSRWTSPTLFPLAPRGATLANVGTWCQPSTPSFGGLAGCSASWWGTDPAGWRSEWKQTCERIAQQKACLHPRGTVDLDHFMQSASAPARAMQALRWMNKHAQLDMDLGNVAVPAVPRAAAGPKGQAPVAEPVLIPLLEDRIKELHDLGDERWSALLAPWLICFGMVRYAHVMRTEPLKLTGAFPHCRCSRGKQHQHRAGFDYAIPGTFLNGFTWSRELMELYRTLVPAKQKSCGLCFSDEGKPWSINEIQQTMRAELGLHVENVETMTTYSWRRVSPTFGQLLRFSDQELSALGDWQEKKDMPSEGQMALHYSSAKYAASLKVLSATMKNGAKLCPLFQVGTCPNEASTCTHGAHLCAILQKTGRTCGGKHPANQCKIKKFVSEDTVLPVPAKPTAALIPAATGPKVATRKRSINLQEAKAEVLEDRKRARTGEAAPVVPQPIAPPRVRRPAPDEEAVDRRLEQLGVGGGKTAQAPTLIWESVRGGRLYLSGLPTRATAAQFPEVALQVCCFPGGPECRQGVTLRGAQLMTFSAAYASQRSEQWRELWPAVQHTLFAGDSVLMHCMKGKHRAAFTGILTRALLAGETIDEANRYVENLRNTELSKVTRERGMAQWLHQTWRDSQLVTPMPLPAAYAATEHSNIHVMTAEGVTLCRHKQADGKTKRLVNPMTTTDVYEATAWSRPWCDGCLRLPRVPGVTRGSAKKSGLWARTVSLLQGINALPKAVALPVMKQESIVLAFRKLFPAAWFENFQFGMIEDLVNSPPFSCYPEWLASQGEAWDGPLTPHLASGELRACFEVIEAVTRVEPRREFPVLPFSGLRVLAASDAAIEEDAPGSGGFHLIFFQADGSQLRQSFVAANCAELRALWQPAARIVVPGQRSSSDDASERPQYQQ